MSKSDHRFPAEERPAREAYFNEAGPLTPYLAVDIGDAIFFVETADSRVGRDLFVRGVRNDLGVLAKALRKLRKNGVEQPADAVLVDVGANIGTTTIHALREHGFVTAVAIEPSPSNVRTLRINLAANDLTDRVTAFAAAAGREHGSAVLDVSRDHGRHRLLSDPVPAGDTVEVEVLTLDELVDRRVIDPQRVGLLWIDVQGHECEVLDGASALIDAGVPIVVAVSPRRGLEAWFAGSPPLVDRLGAAYTHIRSLRKRQGKDATPQPAEALGETLRALTKIQDFLIFRK